MADERKDRMTTEEEERELSRRKKDGENGPYGEVKEDVPPDSPPDDEQKNELERERDVQKQKVRKEDLYSDKDK
ncbi:hypothetical protein [Salinicoccus carnicancri]|uniref:hypothetical protein n=1 Tax=Salinicoccus carnicancri TaxID=558170 RepID=UPI0002DFB3B8|nr:hypothetical protein [Salinicoccus carnicancri]